MNVHKYSISLEHVPVDLFADPDGAWSYEELVIAAGLDPDAKPPPVVAALSERWYGHPDGAAVIASNNIGDRAVTVIECRATSSVSRAA